MAEEEEKARAEEAERNKPTAVPISEWKGFLPMDEETGMGTAYQFCRTEEEFGEEEIQIDGFLISFLGISLNCSESHEKRKHSSGAISTAWFETSAGASA